MLPDLAQGYEAIEKAARPDAQLSLGVYPSSLTGNMDLADLFNHYGSDKDRNGYTPLYHALFDKMKGEPIVMLEIGIGTMIPGAASSMVGYSLQGYKPGGSLRAWRDYFQKGQIFGVDIQQDTQFFDEPRIQTLLCNSTSPEQTALFAKAIVGLNFGRAGLSGRAAFDIIIDDGSHVDAHQLATLRNFYPLLKQGGLYIIEDIYPGSEVSKQPAKVGEACGGDPYFFSGTQANLCVIYKKKLNSKRQGY